MHEITETIFFGPMHNVLFCSSVKISDARKGYFVSQNEMFDVLMILHSPNALLRESGERESV